MKRKQMKRTLKKLMVAMNSIRPAIKRGTCFLFENSTYRAVNMKNLRVEAVKIPFDGIYYYFDEDKVRKAEKLW